MSIILEAKDLSKNYGTKEALRHVNLTLHSGRIIGLLGPNGSGKTTFIKIANGLLTPSSGQLFIAGEKPGINSKTIVSYLPDAKYLPDWMNVEELLRTFQTFFSDFCYAKAEEMLSELNISLQDKLKNLSKGNKEKVQLILAMSRQAKVYILDEPIGGVDPATRDYILKTIISNYSEDALVLLSTHLIADVEAVLDEAIFLRNGEVLFHRNVEEIRETEGKSVDAYFREVFAC